ncbi:hypothetical protein HMPREF6485_0825 [Segatella buccae ATCC 33574]|uniref:Uncharacterized protein n=1 Tax=Segatella buccae ATCC 33574 TaxID=873513 RepID=E6K5I5_9BACT|nr:hypothetical protein HMPREF6485_0825 [Segatella buccae ATCC 33574]
MSASFFLRKLHIRGVSVLSADFQAFIYADGGHLPVVFRHRFRMKSR